MVKFKKIRKKFKRKFKKKFKRKFKQKYRRSKYKNPFKRMVKVKLFLRIPTTGYEILGDTGGEISRYGYWMLNNPTQPSGGYQPQYYDQLKALYERFKVTGCKYKLKFSIRSNAYPANEIPDKNKPRGLVVNLGVPPGGTNALPGAGTSMTAATARKMGMHPDIQQKILHYDPSKGSTATFSKYVDFRKVIGNKYYTEGANFEIPDNGDPAFPMYLCWTATKQDDSILDKLVFYVTGWFKFYTVCTRRELVTDV